MIYIKLEIMSKDKSELAFSKENYVFLIIGLAINILGFILMIGGATHDYNVFDKESLFSTTRITIAPILIVAGYVVIMYAIMKSGHKKEKK